MAVDVRLEVRPFGLVPKTKWDAEELSVFRHGVVVRASISTPRGGKLSRFYWAMCSHLAKASGYPDKEALSDELLIRTGRVEAIREYGGTITGVPRRISKMDHEAFKAYVRDAVELIIREYLPGTATKEFGEVERMIGIKRSEAFE